MWLTPWLCAQAWQSGLAEAEKAKDQGRYYAAAEQLEALRDEHPDVGRIRLDLAVVYINLDRFAEAIDLVDSVLAEPEIPEAVRVNALLLRRSIERRQTRLEQPDIRLTLGLDAGIEPSRAVVIGSQATLYRRQYLRQANVADRPLRQFWQIGLTARHSAYPESDISVYQVHPEAGLVNQMSALELLVFGGYRLTENDSGPSFRTRLFLSLNDAVTGRAEWLSVWEQAVAEHRLRLGARWQWTDRWSLNTDWRQIRWYSTADDNASAAYEDLTLALAYSRGAQVSSGLRMPIDATDDSDLIMTLNVPLSANRWSLDNRLALPVSSMEADSVLDSLSWRTGVSWDL